jgi:peptide-methionine (R)-S-oxide reductase
MKKSLIYAGAAAVTALAWFGAFRPGPGDVQSLRDGGTAVAASPDEDQRANHGVEEGHLLLFSADEGRLVVVDKVVKSEEEWRRELTPEQYRILRQKHTEKPGSGGLLHNKEAGVYTCAACGTALFASDTKYDSGSGWPSFYAPIAKENVATEDDSSLGMRRIEILCRRCGGHLGHVFDDGPQPTGLRYCVNSASLDFVKKGK